MLITPFRDPIDHNRPMRHTNIFHMPLRQHSAHSHESRRSSSGLMPLLRRDRDRRRRRTSFACGPRRPLALPISMSTEVARKSHPGIRLWALSRLVALDVLYDRGRFVVEREIHGLDCADDVRGA